MTYQSSENISAKLKIEINPTEHYNILPLEKINYGIDSEWFKGNTDILTYHLNELMGSKLQRARSPQPMQHLREYFNRLEKKKIFFLTKTIPTTIPFECHACLPLLSATVFTMNKGNWNIESQNLFLMYEGEYGISPKAKLIVVGKNKHGLLLEFEHWGGGTDKEIALLIPYKKSISNAYQETIYYDNFNDCGWSIQCAAFTSELEFNKLKLDDDYYQLRVKRFGTEDDETQNYKAIPIDEEVSYRFLDGKYVRASRKGFPKIKYK